MIAGKKRIAPYLPYLRSKGRFSFGCTVLFSFLRAVPAAFIGGGNVPFRPLIERIACGKKLLLKRDPVVPGFVSYETLLCSPKWKFCFNRVKTDADLNTNIRRLHCPGDSSGWTRGRMTASVMGVLMGREIIRQENV